MARGWISTAWPCGRIEKNPKAGSQKEYQPDWAAVDITKMRSRLFTYERELERALANRLHALQSIVSPLQRKK